MPSDIQSVLVLLSLHAAFAAMMYRLQAQNTTLIHGSYSTAGAAGIVCGMTPDDSQSPLAQQPDLAMRNELTTQLSLAPSKFVVINTAGVVELEKRRPADALAIILEEKNSAKLEQFFRAYGPAEVAAMCFMLATQPASILPQVICWKD